MNSSIENSTGSAKGELSELRTPSAPLIDAPPAQPPREPPLLVGPGGEEFEPTHTIVVDTKDGPRRVSLIARPFVALWGEGQIGDSMVLIAMESSSIEARKRVFDALSLNPEIDVESGAPRLMSDYFAERSGGQRVTWLRAWEKFHGTMTPQDIIREIDFVLSRVDGEATRKPARTISARRHEVTWETLSDSWCALLETHFVLEAGDDAQAFEGADPSRGCILSLRDRTRHAVAGWFGLAYGSGRLSFDETGYPNDDRLKQLAGQLLDVVKQFWDLSFDMESLIALYSQTKAFFKMYPPPISV